MKQLKKTLLTLVALLALTTQAWAKTDPNSVYWDYQIWSGWTNSETTHTVGDITITCSGNAKAYEIQESGNPLRLEAGNNDAITFTSNGKPFASVAIITGDELNVAGWTYNSSTWSYEWSGTPSTSVTLSGCNIRADVITFTFASSASAVEVAWDKTTKTGTFTQPAGNVTVSVEYFPQAALTAAPTAINDVPATTDGAIVKAGTVANIGSTETAQGTVMYYVSTTALDDDALLALAADQWTADVPTAESLAQGQAYVYYYVRGNDSDTDEENFSDGDILAANALTVTIAAEPTYYVDFAEDTPEPDKWSATPNTGVTKGETVTVTYTGERKVIGVKAEKMAPGLIVNPAVGQVIGDDGKNYADAAAATSAGATAVAKIVYVGRDNGEAAPYNHGLALALSDASCKWKTSQTDAGHTKQTSSTFTEESGLQYNDATHNSDTYPAFKAAIANNGTAAPTGCSSWFLASGYQWNKIIGAAGLSNLGLQSGTYYWSSTEYNAGLAWGFDSNGGTWIYGYKDNDINVRACIAF